MSNDMNDNRTPAEYQILNTKLDHVQSDIQEIKIVLRGSYVTRDQFTPVKFVVYGLVAVIMVSVMAAVLTMVLRDTRAMAPPMPVQMPLPAPMPPAREQ